MPSVKTKPYPKHSFPPTWKGQAQRNQKTDFGRFGLKAKCSDECPSSDVPELTRQSAVCLICPALSPRLPHCHQFWLDLQPDPTKDVTVSRSTQLEIWAWVCPLLSAAAHILISLERGVKLQPECAVLC